MQLLNCANISLQEGGHCIGTIWFYVSLIQARVTGGGGTSTQKMPLQTGLWARLWWGRIFLSDYRCGRADYGQCYPWSGGLGCLKKGGASSGEQASKQH